MRCFISIDLPKEVQKELEEAQKKLPDAKMNLVKPENIHLTMKFLGEVNEQYLEKAKSALMRIKYPKFQAKLGNMGVFPNPSFIRVVWAGVEPKDKFLEIHNMIDEELMKEGFSRDSVFENHATLARVKWLKDKREFMDKMGKIRINPLEFPVKSIALKKSTLTESGPVYEDLFEVKLQ